LNEKMACSFGDAATTSFFPAKPLGCYGDGGAIFTNDDKLANVIRSLSVHGKDGADKYNNIRVGMNSRLDTIQAAVLNVKFNAFVTYENEQTNIAADYYTKELMEFINCPIIPQGYYSSRAQYTITLNDKNQRDNLQKFLKDNSIPSMVYYPRTMSQQGALNRYIKCQPFECEVAKQLTSTCLSLPIGPYITKCEQDRVISYVKLFLKQ
ncbi:MAG: DegT/DnrJ/EryC1/StrS family aminotransferase, partial [Oscillospiraceae bacterium]